MAEDHRWAGDLAASIARVTAANLGRRLHTGNVRTYPWRNDGEISYQVTLDIRQLHGGDDGYAVIEAGWRAYSLPDRRLKASRTFVDREAAGIRRLPGHWSPRNRACYRASPRTSPAV